MSREKFSILSLKPRSHVRILIYRTWAKRLVLEAEHWPSGCLHVPFSVTSSITCPHTLLDNWQWANFVFSYILGDPGAVSRAGRKGATKVFKHRRKSPWVPTLTGPFPNGQAIAGSWLGTKNALYYCAQSANSIPWVLFVSSYTTAIDSITPRLVSTHAPKKFTQAGIFQLDINATFQNTGSLYTRA